MYVQGFLNLNFRCKMTADENITVQFQYMDVGPQLQLMRRLYKGGNDLERAVVQFRIKNVIRTVF